MNTIKRTAMLAAVIAGLLVQAGCADMSRKDKNTALGAGAGAVIGGILTGGSTGGVVGGAAVGGVIGNRVK